MSAHIRHAGRRLEYRRSGMCVITLRKIYALYRYPTGPTGHEKPDNGTHLPIIC